MERQVGCNIDSIHANAQMNTQSDGKIVLFKRNTVIKIQLMTIGFTLEHVLILGKYLEIAVNFLNYVLMPFMMFKVTFGRGKHPHVRVVYVPSKSTANKIIVSNSFYPPNSGRLEIMPEFFKTEHNNKPEQTLIHELLHIIGFQHEFTGFDHINSHTSSKLVDVKVVGGIMSSIGSKIVNDDLYNIKMLYTNSDAQFDETNSILRVSPIYNSLSLDLNITIDKMSYEAEARLKKVAKEFTNNEEIFRKIKETLLE